MYCFHDKIRIYFMSFVVQISPFIHLLTLNPEPPTRAMPWTCWGPYPAPRPLAASCAYISFYT